MKYFVTSDFHFFHSNIIALAGRPFSNVEEMNNTMIERFNSLVEKEDQIFFLGDFNMKQGFTMPDGKPFETARKQLNGEIFFIDGNHDHNGRNGLKTKIQGMVIRHGGIDMYLCHKPEDAKLKYNLVGHTHKLQKAWKFQDKYYVNCCVEAWNYYPINLDTIVGKYYNKTNFKEDLFPELEEQMRDK
jgi:calcineurin-like phosphoesterase family protein